MRSALKNSKNKLADAALLIYLERKAQLSLHTDVSDTAVGAVLQQFSEGIWQPLGFFSRKLKPAQMRYSAYDRELLAIYTAIKHFRHWIKGSNFYVLTDHKPLIYRTHFHKRSIKLRLANAGNYRSYPSLPRISDMCLAKTTWYQILSPVPLL